MAAATPANVPVTAQGSMATNDAYLVVIGDETYAPGGAIPANGYWYLVVSLIDLSVAVNEVSNSNDSVPASVKTYAGNTDYMLLMMTLALKTDHLPQGPLSAFLRATGSGPLLQRAEQVATALGTGSLGWVSYILAATLDEKDAPGFEEMSFWHDSLMTFQMMPVDVDGSTRYTPVRVGG